MHAMDMRDVYIARKMITNVTIHTPLVLSETLSEIAETQVYLKIETMQPTGSFKLRGAANRLLHLGNPERAAGVVTVSTGNHGKAVAYVARLLAMRAVVCVPELVLSHKVAAMQKLGAEIVVHGADQDAAEVHAQFLADEEGLTLVSPFDDPFVIAGQGTIALELVEQLPEVDTVIVPLSGGGLMGGISLALKHASGSIRTIGVSMDRGAAMVASLEAGHPVPVVEEATLADSLMGGIGLENRHTFRLIQQYVDETILLSEPEIAAGMRHALLEEHLVVEGGGAVGIGAVLANKVSQLGKHVAIVVSGGNADMERLRSLIA